MIVCEICGRECKNLGFGSHIKTHNMNSREYYDKYLKKENEGICSECGKETNFYKSSNGYFKFCSTKCSNKSKETIEKKKKTCFKNYGVEYPSQNKKIKEKQEQKSLENYGVKYPTQNKEVKEKRNKTFLKKYNGNPLKNKEVVERMKKTRLRNFLPKVIKLLHSSNLQLLSDYNRNRELIKVKCLKCNLIFETQYFYIQQNRGRCPNCFPGNKSSGEIELLEFIKSLNLNVIENNRNILDGKELDIFIPLKNIAIEFNGLYYHSENNGKDKNYHLNKTEECLNKNIQLIHIFEDEWMYKKEIVKSKLKQILGINNSERIYIYNCEVKEISPKIKNEFLNKYHIQGEDKSNIKLGAFYDNKLISVMTFSKGNISKGSKNVKGVYELNRFCSNSDYHILEIFLKLLSHFKKNYNWKEIFSYADRRWSDGNLYYNLEFELEHITKPNYWYTRGHLDRINSRNISHSEEGYFRIWDCGYYKFKIDNNID